MRRKFGIILTALGIFGFFYGIFNWRPCRDIIQTKFHYYTDGTKILIAASAVVVFLGIMLLKGRKGEAQ